MLRILRLDSTSRLPAVQSALARARVRQVGLLFPPEGNAALASEDTLTKLRLYCEAIGKAAVILGGNVALRAAAVAAGFPAATSRDAWESAVQPHAPEHAGGGSWQDGDGSYVRIVRPEPTTDTWSDEPPDFVMYLLARSGAYPGPHDDDALATLPHRAPPTGPLDDLHDNPETLLRAHERHEERFTSRIRTTGSPVPPAVGGRPDLSAPIVRQAQRL